MFDSNETVNIAGMIPDDILNGPGVRFTVFVQGCLHCCRGCQNPETWKFKLGTPYTLQQIYDKIKEYSYIKKITFSGGDPIYSSDKLLPLVKLLKEEGYEICIYTGFSYEEIQDFPILQYCDILIDGEFIQDLKTLSLPFRGSSNQRMLYLEKGKIIKQE